MLDYEVAILLSGRRTWMRDQRLRLGSSLYIRGIESASSATSSLQMRRKPLNLANVEPLTLSSLLVNSLFINHKLG